MRAHRSPRPRPALPAGQTAARRRLELVCLAALWIFVARLGAQELPLTHFTTEHQRSPLPSSSVQTVHQDRLGFLWLGFYSTGVARWDGGALELYGLDDGLLDPTVRAIVEDAQGFLWVASETGLVVSGAPLDASAARRRLSFRGQVAGTELWKGRLRRHWLVADSAGSVWMTTADGGLRRYRLDAGLEGNDRLEQQVVAPLHPGSPAASALVARRDGSVWLALDDASVAVVAAGDRNLELLPSKADAPLTAFHEGRNGTLWAGDRRGGVWRLATEGPRHFVRVSPDLGEQVSALWETRQGELWVASLGAGLSRIEPGEPDAPARRIERRDGLLTDTVWYLFEDREDNLWIAHNAGLSRLPPNYRAFAHWTGTSRAGEPVLPEPTAFSVLPPLEPRFVSESAQQLAAPASVRPDAGLWIGTGGGVAIFVGGRRDVLDVSDGLLSNSVYSLARDAAGRIWVGTQRGLNVLSFGPPLPTLRTGQPADARQVEILGQPAWLGSYAVETVYALHILPLPTDRTDARQVESVWSAGTAGLCVWVADPAQADGSAGRWFHFRASTGLPAAGTTTAALGPDGHLWVGTQAQGLLRSRVALDVETLETLPVAADGRSNATVDLFEPTWDRSRGAPTNHITFLLRDAERLWVATAGGMTVLAGDPPRPVPHAESPSGRVLSLARDPATGGLWAANNAGLVRISPRNGRTLRSVTQHDGLIDDEAWSAGSLAAGKDGSIFLATPKGLTRYRPDLDRGPRALPDVVLREISATDQRGFAFRYAALAFANPGRVRFQTRLVGYDETWSPPSLEHGTRYTSLPALFWPRRYTFEVVAVDGDDRWSPPARAEVRVAPPAWLSWWAGLFYLGVIGLGLVAAHRRRVRQLQYQTAKLEEAVEQRTELVRAQVQELETLDQIVEAVNREMEPHAVMGALLAEGLRLLPMAERGAFGVLDHLHDRFEIVASSGWDLRRFESFRLTVDEARQRYAQGAVPLDDGIFVVRRRGRSGAEIPMQTPIGPLESVAAAFLLSVEVSLGTQAEGYLVFSISDSSALESFETKKLQRYRRHAISALDKARRLAELRQRRREAEQANLAKSAFLASMSHELRTPLSSILGFAEILLRQLEGKLEDRQLKFLSNIESSGRHLLGLINDILDLSKIEAGKMHLDLGKVSLGHVLEGVATMLHGVAVKRRVEVACEISEDLPAVLLDGPKVKQILYNLVSNAIKFSPDGGTVRLIANVLRAESSPLGFDSVEIAVRDDGIGIDPADHEVIFEEFRQLSSDAARRYPGTGLGLALVRRYSELMGGRVELESETGAGSTFRLHLPLDATWVVEAAEREASGVLTAPRALRELHRQETEARLRAKADEARDQDP